MAKTKDTPISQIIINKLSKAQYEGIETKDPSQLYFVTDEDKYLTEVTTDASLFGKGTTEDPLKVSPVLPDQTDNAGKFLTTDGTAAFWETIKQGSGIEWFKELSTTKAEYNAYPDEKSGYIGLRFKMPVGLPDGAYEFYTRGALTPISLCFYTECIIYHKAYVSDGRITDMVSYRANPNEMAFGDATGQYGSLYWNSEEEAPTVSSYAGYSGWFFADAIPPFYFDDLGDNDKYDTVKITKIKNMDTGETYEPTNVEQFFGPRASVENENTDVLFPLVNINMPQYSTASHVANTGLSGPEVLTFGPVPNAWISGNVNTQWGIWYPWPTVVNVWKPGFDSFAEFEFLFYKGEVKARLVRGTGSFSNASDFTVSRVVGYTDDSSEVRMCIKKSGGFGDEGTLCAQMYSPNMGGIIWASFDFPSAFDSEHSVQVVPATEITVDDQLSTTSTNPAQNKVITAGLSDKADKTALPQNQTGTEGQVYTKTADGAEWADATSGLPQVSTIAEFSSPVAADLNKLVLYVGPTVDADEASIQKILDSKIINGHVFSVVERTLVISETETETIYMWKDVYENIPTVGDETNNKILSNDGLNIEWVDAPSATEVIMREL